MKSLKRFGFVMVSLLVVLGFANVSFAAAAKAADTTIKPSATISLSVNVDGDDEAEALKASLLITTNKAGEDVLAGFSAAKGKIAFKNIDLTKTSFGSIQKAVDYAEEVISYLNEFLAAAVKAKAVSNVDATKFLSTVCVYIEVAPGSYDGFSASDMNLTVMGKPRGFVAKYVGRDEDEDVENYVIIGKGNAGSAISVEGGICVLQNLYIEGGKSAIGGGVYFGKVYGGLIQNCYFENNTAAYGAAVALSDCVSNQVINCLATNNKVTRKGKAGGTITVLGGQNNLVYNNWLGGNKAINGLSAGIAVYQGKKNAIVGNIVKENSAAKGYPNFQIILGGTGVTEDDETSAVTGLVVDANVVMGCYKTNKNKYLAKNEYGIAEEIGEKANEFIDIKGHKLINNSFVYGTLNYAYRNSTGARQFKNISMESFEDVNNPELTGAKAIRKSDKNTIVFYREGWKFTRKISGKDYRKQLRPNVPVTGVKAK